VTAASPRLAEIVVGHNPAASRFEAIVGGLLCVANYHLVDDVIRLHHTEVPSALRHLGIAGKLVQAALDYATAHHLKVEPWCGYVRSYMKRHPETQRLLPEGFSI
jgi:predicted GNAT family acetyltransferase